MWALAAGGEDGVTSAIEILSDEFANALRLAGCATITELRANASAVLRRSDACVLPHSATRGVSDSTS